MLLRMNALRQLIFINSSHRNAAYQWYPAKRALSAMRKHGA